MENVLDGLFGKKDKVEENTIIEETVETAENVVEENAEAETTAEASIEENPTGGTVEVADEPVEGVVEETTDKSGLSHRVV